MCPKTKEQFAAIRQKSEEKILQVALELFVTKGFKATSISSIALKANISKGLLYNYFDSKSDLLRRIVSDAIETGKEMFTEAITAYDSPAEELEHFVLSVVENIKTHTQYWHLLTSLAFQPDVLSEVQDLLDQSVKWNINRGTEIFSKMGSKDPMQDSLLFGASLDGIMLHYLHLRDSYPIDAIAQRLIKSYCTTPNLINSN